MNRYYIFKIEKLFHLALQTEIANNKEELKVIEHDHNVWILKQKISWKKIQKKQLNRFTRDFLFLLKNGLSYLEILELMHKYEKKRVIKKMLGEIIIKIEEGSSLYDSFFTFEDFFGNFYLNMLYIGEQSGNLEKTFFLLLEYLEHREKIKKKIGSILLYPAILFFFMCLLLIGVLYFILPAFLTLFDDMKLELPMITRILIRFRILFPWIFVFFFCVIELSYFLYRQQKIKWLREKVDTFVFRMFYKKSIYGKVLGYRFSKYFEMLLDSGFSFQEILPILEKNIKNQELKKRFCKMHQIICKGGKISQAFTLLNIFSQKEIYFLLLGEESGNLAEIFKKIAILLEMEIQDKIKKYFILLEPCLFVLLGSLLAIVILGIYLPIFSLNTVL